MPTTSAGCVCDFSDDHTVVLETSTTVVSVDEEVITVVIQPETYNLSVINPVSEVHVEETTQEVIHQEQVITIVEACKQGVPGPPGAGGETAFEAIIPAGNTEVVDSLSLTAYRSCRWTLSTADDTVGSYQYLQVNALHDGADVQWSAGAKLGTLKSVVYSVEVSGSFFNLVAVNNGPNDAELNGVRQPLET